MCRYYTAEGVRIYSQETWNGVTGGKGKQLVEQHIADVVQRHLFLSVKCDVFCCIFSVTHYLASLSSDDLLSHDIMLACFMLWLSLIHISEPTRPY